MLELIWYAFLTILGLVLTIFFVSILSISLGISPLVSVIVVLGFVAYNTFKKLK